MSRIEDGGAVEVGLVERLEAWAGTDAKGAPWSNPWRKTDLEAAAAEITRLRAENAGMREAAALAKLEPHVFYSTRAAAGRLRAELGLIGTDQPDTRKLLAFVERLIEDERAALSKASQAEGGAG